MMNNPQIHLFDDHSWDNLLPLTFTRPVSHLRVGIITIAEKWEHDLGSKASTLTRKHLSGKFPCQTGEDNLFINGSLLPDREVVKAILALKNAESLEIDGTLLAVRSSERAEQFEVNRWLGKGGNYKGDVSLVDFPWKIFELNGQEIKADFLRLTAGRESSKLSDTVQVIDGERVFAEPGFKGEYITLNASLGPIYLGRDSEIMEGSVIRGPFGLCERSTVKMSAKIYGPTTIGPDSQAGGEIKNSVIQGSSNKSHDGYLGNSVIGEWCNLGADTNNSNLKNNYSEVNIWNYASRGYMGTGSQFCGLIMGDHSKCGINTMFNTGTVVGVSANIFGSGFLPKFVPSFSWGGAGGFTHYQLEKMLETAAEVMSRRETRLTDADRAILEFIFSYTEEFRNGT
ncbi:MAG: GlmU family protein [Bacteroidota bacterium]